MPAAKRAVGGKQRLAHDVQVTDGVEDLVLDELVLVAQAIGVEHLEIVHHDRVVQTAPQAQAA